MIIPELEEESKTYRPTGVRTYTDDEDDTLLRYFGRVSKNSLMKHFPGKTYDALGGHYRRILKQQKKKGISLIKTSDAVPAHIPADGLQETTPAGAPPISEEVPIVPPANEKKKHGGSVGKWKIPFKYPSSAYENARKLCKKHGKPYPEALKLEEAAAKTLAPVSKSRRVVRKQKALPLHQKNHEPEDPAKGTRAQEIHIKDVATTPPQDKTRSPLLDPLVIVSGLTVKQVKPDGGRQMYGNGMVVARRGEICEVRNNGKTYHILADCLEIVRGPEKTGDAVGAES